MFRNLLAHNCPSGTEWRAARSRGCEVGDRALLFFPLMDSRPPALPWLNTQQADGDGLLLKGCVNQERKMNHGKAGSQQDRRKQVVWGTGCLRQGPGEVQGFLPQFGPCFT